MIAAALAFAAAASAVAGTAEIFRARAKGHKGGFAQRLAAAVRIGPRPVPVPFMVDTLPAPVDRRVGLWLHDQPATSMVVVFGDPSAPEADNNPWLTGIMINLSHGVTSHRVV